ncbi:hypothetical protein THTE_2899 [Thermogutta terrifontis]|uniref:Alternative complex III subunit ActF n=2 Tax=Thermogutta terrifontis TaxID=1331910 RepID=A0A286RHP9_9BACT|nr:hypothetical protein THTE_2899 [Thermogutta terrifontis]
MQATELMDTNSTVQSAMNPSTTGVSRAPQICIIGGAIAIVLGFVLSSSSPAGWLQDYLVHYTFLVSITLGALFFVFLQHLTRAGWSVTVRRTAELMAGTTPMLVAVAFLPIAVTLFIDGLNLYPWAASDFFLHHAELRHKTIYLNIPFFLLRAAFCLAAWWWLGRFYMTRSLAQDTDGDPRWTLVMEKWSPAAALLFTVTVTLAAFDWVMSLAPAWYSTIFPVYIFSGCVVGGLAGLILILLLAQALGFLSHRVVTVEHYHDLGKLLFGFVIFWGYIAFSQYMLIWYGNIPEESQFYLPRQQGIWLYVSLGLVFGHLLIPLVGMMPRAIKRNPWTLGFFAVWLLVFHWLDLYWLIKPNWHPTVGPLSLIGGILGGVGVFGIVIAIVLKGLTRYPPIPVRDPRLNEAIHHEVV